MEPQKLKSNPLIQCVDGLRVKYILQVFIFMCLSSQNVLSQKIWETRKGCIRTQGNFSGGYLFGQKAASAYLNGDIDVFVDDRVGVTGSAFYSFALNRNNQTGLKANHAVFFGINYHFLKPQRFDPFIGFTQGMGLVQAVYKDGDVFKRTPYAAVPLLSATIGFNYYVGSIFNFFAKVQSVTGHVVSTMPSAMRLDELKFMAGLGWNLRLWKPKIKDTWKEPRKS